MLKKNRVDEKIFIDGTNIAKYFDVSDGTYEFSWNGNEFKTPLLWPGETAIKTLIAKRDMTISFNYDFHQNGKNIYFQIKINNKVVKKVENIDVTGEKYSEVLKKDDIVIISTKNTNRSYTAYASFYNFEITINDRKEDYIDPVPPLLSDYFLTKTTEVYVSDDEGNTTTEIKPVYECPYTAVVERGGTYADVLLEYATILRADIYYDVHGRLVIEPLITTADDITDTNKEILWDYTTEDKCFLGMTRTFNFDKVYNDFIVLGNILHGYQFKGRVQNRNPMSDTCVQRIGLRTKEPEENNQYVSDDQCKELAMYDAKIYTIMQKSGQISSVPLFHLDVNKLVTLSTPNNNMSKELYLISGFSLSSNGNMTVEVTSVNVLKNFSVVEAEVYE